MGSVCGMADIDSTTKINRFNNWLIIISSLLVCSGNRKWHYTSCLQTSCWWQTPDCWTLQRFSGLLCWRSLTSSCTWTHTHTHTHTHRNAQCKCLHLSPSSGIRYQSEPGQSNWYSCSNNNILPLVSANSLNNLIRQTDKQTGRQAYRPTDRPTDRE